MYRMQTRNGVTVAAFTGAAVAWCWAALSAQQPPQAPTFRSGVELVSVDVGVVDRQGQPLRGLSSKDFTISVGGQPRRVVSVEYVDVGGANRDTGMPTAGSISTNEGAG